MVLPSCRAESFTADPTPAYDGGTVLITDSVAGAMVAPMPRPISARQVATTAYGLSAETNPRPASPHPLRNRPAATTTLAPTRAASPALRGAATASPTASGSIRTPASRLL